MIGAALLNTLVHYIQTEKGLARQTFAVRCFFTRYRDRVDIEAFHRPSNKAAPPSIAVFWIYFQKKKIQISCLNTGRELTTQYHWWRARFYVEKFLFDVTGLLQMLMERTNGINHMWHGSNRPAACYKLNRTNTTMRHLNASNQSLA